MDAWRRVPHDGAHVLYKTDAAAAAPVAAAPAEAPSADTSPRFDSEHYRSALG